MSKREYEKYIAAPIRSDRKPLHELLPLDQPLRVLIDPSDVCNFRCNFCFQSQQDFKGSVMSLDTFRIIVEQIKEFERPINVVHLYGLGEPLVNKNIAIFVKELKENKVAKEVAITSNGSLLTHELSEKLVMAGLDRLSISLNGITDEHFKKNVNANVDFKKLYEEINYFYKIRNKTHLHVKINGECFTEEEKDKFVKMFVDCTDSINIDHVVNVWSGLQLADNNGQRMYDFETEELNKDEDSRKKVCPLMFYEVLIHPDGNVSPCAVDYTYKKQNLGSIFDNSIKKIWNNEILKKIRIQELLGSKNDYCICNTCKYSDCAATVSITSYRDTLVKKYR